MKGIVIWQAVLLCYGCATPSAVDGENGLGTPLVFAFSDMVSASKGGRYG
jgi:hypothetical protein